MVAFCGDGGLSTLLGDLMTPRTYRLPVRLVVFDDRRPGMARLGQGQSGLPEFGTVLDDPGFAAVAEATGGTGVRVTDPAEPDGAVRRAFRPPGPVLPDVLTDPDTPTRSSFRPAGRRAGLGLRGRRGEGGRTEPRRAGRRLTGVFGNAGRWPG
ncbi:hypothetical protein SUDANB6_01303 [Streptomyces sp. enrichment culture]